MEFEGPDDDRYERRRKFSRERWDDHYDANLPPQRRDFRRHSDYSGYEPLPVMRGRHDDFMPPRRFYRGRRYGRGGRGRGGRGGFARGRRSFDSNFRPSQPVAQDTDNLRVAVIARIGNNPSNDLVKDLDSLAQALVADLKDQPEDVMSTILSCVLIFPQKAPLYGTLAGLLNLEDSKFGAQLVKFAAENLQNSLSSGAHIKTKALLRFLAELANASVIRAQHVVQVLENLLDSVESEFDFRAEHYTSLVAWTLPWIGQELEEIESSSLVRLMTRIEAYINSDERKSKIYPLLQFLYCFKDITENNIERLDPLKTLWVEIGELKQRHSWLCKAKLDTAKSFESKLRNASQHNLQPISIPSSSECTCFPVPHPYTSFLFAANEENAEALQEEPSGIDRLIIYDHISDLIMVFQDDKKEGLARCLTLPYSIPSEGIIVDVLVNHLFRAVPFTKPVYFGVLMVDFCTATKNFPPKMARVIDYLFNNLNHLDVEFAQRFADWFSLHLSNFEFKWFWTDWLPIIKEGKKPQVEWTKHVFEKGMRLSYLEKLKENTPPELHALLPPEPVPVFRFDADDAEASILMENLRQKKPSEDIVLILGSDTFSRFTAEEKVSILMQCLQNLGSKTLTHFRGVFMRYKDTLRQLAVPEHRMVMLNEVSLFWANSFQWISIGVDLLLTLRLVDSSTAVNWIFTHIHDYPYWFVAEVLENVLRKAVARKDTLKVEFEAHQKRLQELKHSKMAVEQEDQSVSETQASEQQQELNTNAEASDTAETQVSKYQTAFEHSNRELKELVLVLFQRFSVCLAAHLSENKEEDFWFRSTLGLMTQIGRYFYRHIKPYIDTLRNILFTSEVHERITTEFRKLEVLEG